mmetsp:Transcript_75984/g.120304  ORF Transcript_75984/g.120304 Transcript_75984/m.120304 type:complete len:393 (+) Transcript_75984:332-1510(+)
MLSCIGVFKKCKMTFLCAEMLLRVLWLLTLNTAFQNFPPEIIIWSETGQNPFGIPSVSKWNPLPLTVHLICCFCIIVVVIFGVYDYCVVRAKAGKETPAPATPEDRYQDPNCHFIGCVCVFGLMTILIIIYAKIVLKPLEMDPKRMGLWLFSVLVQVKITLDDTLPPEDQRQLQYLRQALDHTPNGHGYQPMRSSEGLSHENSAGMHEDKRYEALWKMMHHWYRWSFCMVTPNNRDMWHLLMYAHKGNDKEMRIRNKEGPAEGQWSWLEINSRFFMSYISNGLYKAIIVYTLPLWLSRGGLTDFVLNAFATVYIVDLDDLTDGEKWKRMPMMAYLKFRRRTLTGEDPEDTAEDEEEDEEVAEGFKDADPERTAEAGRLSMYSSEASTADPGL